MGIYYLLLLLLSTWLWITWLKLGFELHHWNISYIGHMQDYIGSASHLQFGYFDLVNPVDQVKHVSQCSDYTNQQWLYFLDTCRRLIMESQFSLDGHSYWVLEFLLLCFIDSGHHFYCEIMIFLAFQCISEYE